MIQNNYFSLKSKIVFHFINSQTRDISYNSFLPDIKKLQTKRSNISIKKENHSLIFNIEIKDITAFRASINEIVSFGKIIENSLKIVENS